MSSSWAEVERKDFVVWCIRNMSTFRSFSALRRRPVHKLDLQRLFFAEQLSKDFILFIIVFYSCSNIHRKMRHV